MYKEEEASGEWKVAVKELKAKVRVLYVLWDASLPYDMYVWGTVS